MSDDEVKRAESSSLLLEQFRHSDASIRNKAFAQLVFIAETLGASVSPLPFFPGWRPSDPAFVNKICFFCFLSLNSGSLRTREELVPYLSEFTDDEDDVLLTLCNQLCILRGLLGGAEHLHVLLLPLEALAGVEEAVVRDKAVEVIAIVLSEQSQKHVVEYVLPLLRRLWEHESFTSRISAAGLFHHVYSRYVCKSVFAHLMHTFYICR